MTDRRQRQPAKRSQGAEYYAKGHGRSGCAATTSDAKASRLGIETLSAPVGSWALRSSESVHPPPPAATCLVREWVRACAAAARFSPHSASPAAFYGSSVEGPYRFRCPPLLHADVRKAEEVERFRLPFSSLLPVVDRKWTKLQSRVFSGCSFRLNLLILSRSSFRNWIGCSPSRARRITWSACATCQYRRRKPRPKCVCCRHKAQQTAEIS